MTKALKKTMRWMSLLVGVALLATTLPQPAAAQDQDDPPDRVARLGYMQGSVSFQPAGEPDWVQAVQNRPMTTGDKLWADRDSRAEVELGSAVIRLAPNTGFSFLNLDDRTVQIQLTSGSLNIRVRRLHRDDVLEVDTPNLAFSVFRPGRYRVEASEDGGYTVVSVREGEGESTGNGQTYTLHAGQRGTFSGTESLNAEVVEIGRSDEFDTWAESRDQRYEKSRSAQYLSQDVVGYEDLDEYGDWRDESSYGHVWFPRVSAGWAPYREGHWDWISPWGWTWVDDASWGYAPFHYGRWVAIGGRWGWVAGPVNVAPVYAPALVVFLGSGGIGVGGNVGWFPLGPREVYVPSYYVSRGYINRVNVSNTMVTSTTITNVYNTTIVSRTTTITNVTYVNRNVAGAVTAVPQRAFVSAQPVAKVAVAVNVREIASVPVSSRATLAPSRESVLGARANSAGRVAAPPAAVANRRVIAKATPPPPPVPFSRQQQALAAHPGQPLERREVQTLRPANASAAHPMVKQAPPGKPATPNVGRAGTPGGPANAGRPGQPANAPPAQPGNRPERNQPPSAQPDNRPERNRPSAQPGRPESNQPEPGKRPEPNRPAEPPARSDHPQPPSAQPDNRPEANRPPAAQPGRPESNQPAPAKRPERNRPAEPPARSDRQQPPAAQPNNRPEANRPPAAQPNRTEPNQPEPGKRPEPSRPAEPPARSDRPQPPAAQPDNRPERNRPPAAQPNRTEPSQPAPAKRPEPNRPAEPPARSDRPQPPAAKPSGPQQKQRGQPKPEEKKGQDEKQKRDEKPQSPPQ